MIPLDPLPNLIDQVYARILEAITDRCEDVANLIEGVVVENS